MGETQPKSEQITNPNLLGRFLDKIKKVFAGADLSPENKKRDRFFRSEISRILENSRDYYTQSRQFANLKSHIETALEKGEVTDEQVQDLISSIDIALSRTKSGEQRDQDRFFRSEISRILENSRDYYTQSRQFANLKSHIETALERGEITEDQAQDLISSIDTSLSATKSKEQREKFQEFRADIRDIKIDYDGDEQRNRLGIIEARISEAGLKGELTQDQVQDLRSLL